MARGNSFEGGSNGVSLIQGSGGNTGNTSGNFLDNVNIGTSATVAFSTAQAAHGSVSMLTATAGSSALAYGGYTLASLGSDFARGYHRFTALPGAVQIFMRYLSGGVQCFRLNVKSGGAIEVRDSSNGVVGTTTNVVTAGSFFRCEVNPTFHVSAGALGLRLFLSPNSAIPTETLSLSNLAFTGLANEVRWGIGAAVASAGNMHTDNVAAEGSTWFGPALATGTADRITIFGTAVTGTPTVLGTAARVTAFGASGTGSRTVLGTAARATTIATSAAGVRTVLGIAARTAAFGTTAAGQRTVTATAARATAFTAPAVGQVVSIVQTPGVLTASTPTAVLTATGRYGTLRATTPVTPNLAATTNP